ncbi:serine/threonine protein kinase [Streptomyces sp. NTH33]|uniref:serine/threonine-protein kinase n=1 Tax=Streptomyces sp. NTH33 TaxID=1735453 RepID=UPI000DAA83F9|nr:serine/threonine-protein kinase [Streptomyces sp. NTH33]PZG92635.1 serine/threonine protein kinase [Streptomyces sp. NTH33]
MTATRAAVRPPLPAGTRPVEGYEVIGLLDRTGWMDVYDSWSEERACRCVIKMVRPDLRDAPEPADRLLREGRWLCAFTHPHLARAYETFTEPEPLVVMETLTGETLAHLIGRLRRRPAATDVALLGVQLCSAVHYLHGRDLLHLDLKPSNVVVERGHVKVLDLSTAQPPGDAPSGVGTFGYLSPEQARGGLLTAAADVWGIGVTLYEVAGGDPPFHRNEGGEGGESGTYGRTTGDRRYPQLEAAAPPIASLRRLPRPLAAAIDGCLSPEPADRPTVAELTAALTALLSAPA